MFGGMKIYTVHVKPGMSNAGEKPVFIKEGFNVWAFLLTIFWTLYHRLWLPALLVLAFNIALIFLTRSHVLTHDGGAIVDLGFRLLVGFLANDWLRGRLARRGYVLADITAGDSLLRAEQRYFERYLAVA